MSLDSQRHPGLGMVLLAVYGITPDLRETRLPRPAGGLFRRVIRAAAVALQRPTSRP